MSRISQAAQCHGAFQQPMKECRLALWYVNVPTLETIAASHAEYLHSSNTTNGFEMRSLPSPKAIGKSLQITLGQAQSILLDGTR